MRIDLWELAKSGEKAHTKITITERLPPHLEEPCVVTVHYEAKAIDDFFLLTMTTQAELNIYCQRCAQVFQFPYKNTLELAICDNENRAESLAMRYESLAVEHGRVDLETLITDELYLYAPQFHENEVDCDQQIESWLVKNNTNK